MGRWFRSVCIGLFVTAQCLYGADSLVGCGPIIMKCLACVCAVITCVSLIGFTLCLRDWIRTRPHSLSNDNAG